MRALPPIDIITIGIRISTYEFWGETNIQTLAIINWEKVGDTKRAKTKLQIIQQ